MPKIVFIALGSNLGDRQANCKTAIDLLKKNSIYVLKISSWHETKAVTLNEEPQPDYINGVVQIETDLTPHELLEVCKKIECDMGRTPTGKRWQARVIDLDILLYGDLALDTPELKIPHPEMEKREFVMTPLREILRS
ncbi:MAG: 2-amino-4-hydroxy-6-hydroxymethyldihydropteridine diphosphokinase [Deltaproteobacteria bacterium]|nr:2-amino-4-hydroxy-6-hydroxymethyldihydropteridine diphosphokinase [Deltaproteobacteria bacterium]